MSFSCHEKETNEYKKLKCYDRLMELMGFKNVPHETIGLNTIKSMKLTVKVGQLNKFGFHINDVLPYGNLSLLITEINHYSWKYEQTGLWLTWLDGLSSTPHVMDTFFGKKFQRRKSKTQAPSSG